MLKLPWKPPRTDHGSLRTIPSPPPPQSDISLTQLNVLLLEPQPHEARVICETLLESDVPIFRIEHASHLAAALHILTAKPVDVVLLNPTLPDSRGIASVETVCHHPAQVPVVLLAAPEDEAMANRAVQIGAQDCLVKGYSDGSLMRRALRYAVERHTLQQALKSLSIIDELTGLYNRRGFLTLGEEQMKLARRTGWSMALLYMDLDGLKKINDTFGHAEGDRMLVDLARVLRASFRSSDILARLGGDEFAVLAPNVAQDRSGILVDRIQTQIEGVNRHRLCRLSLSIGMRQFEALNSEPLDREIARADDLMYRQKRYRLAADESLTNKRDEVRSHSQRYRSCIPFVAPPCSTTPPSPLKKQQVMSRT